MDAKTEANLQAINALLNGIKEEMKDFHGRLCAIEERNKKWYERNPGFHFYDYDDLDGAFQFPTLSMGSPRIQKVQGKTEKTRW